MLKGFKIRLYPTREQQEKIFRNIGACRFIWNYMLNEQNIRLIQSKSSMSGFEMCYLLPSLKKSESLSWLKEIPAGSLVRVCNDLGEGFLRFYKKKANRPKFKTKKKSKMTYPADIYSFDDKHVQVAKLGKVKYKTDYALPKGKQNKGRYKNVRITYDNGKFILSFVLDCETQAIGERNGSIGVDVGIKELAVVAFNDECIKFHNINNSEKMKNLTRIAKKRQRNISRKYLMLKENNKTNSNNIIKEIHKYKKVLRKIKNIRLNYIHQVTHAIISLQPERIVVEDLNIAELMQHKTVSGLLHEQSLSEFLRQINYKAIWNTIEIVKADRFYPSSKTCSCCGSIKRNLSLYDRKYICDNCGLQIDRDYNAALNLKRYKA